MKRIAVTDTLPADTEGIFKSTLVAKPVDILPEIGSGSLTAVLASPEPRAQTPQEKEVEDSKDVVKMASRPSSRPATQEKPGSRPQTQEKIASRPGTQEGSRPASKEKVASRPGTQEKPGSRPVTQEGSRPGTQASEAKSGSLPPTQEKVASRPGTQEKPGSRQSKVASRPGTQEGSRPGTQASEGKAGSRPATREAPVEVRSAPPTPEPEAREKIVVGTTPVNDQVEGNVPSAQSGEFKPLNAEPPTVTAGVFKPLMAEPPRPRTPAEKVAQMSGSIEKPSIDGRHSAADRVVEANLYGDHVVSGEVPIMKREGSIVINIEDTLRTYEDHVDSITFNRSVHNAMRKFARNLILRKIKVTQYFHICFKSWV